MLNCYLQNSGTKLKVLMNLYNNSYLKSPLVPFPIDNAVSVNSETEFRPVKFKTSRGTKKHAVLFFGSYILRIK